MSNRFGIPELAPETFDGEWPKNIGIWRKHKVSKPVDIWLFYCDDYKIEPIWRRPEKPARAPALSELNFSVFEDSPAALAIWNVYRKRYVSKIWQELGVKVWIDLCFPQNWGDLALVGVPDGWPRYSTRGFAARIGDLEQELRWARERSGGKFQLLVYSGGKEVEYWCRNRQGVLYIPHFSEVRHRPGEGTRRRLSRPTGRSRR